MFGLWYVCLYIADIVWSRDLKFGHSTLLVTRVPFSVFPIAHSVNFKSAPLHHWWISKSNSSKESCCEVEYAYDKIHVVNKYRFFSDLDIFFRENGYKMVKNESFHKMCFCIFFLCISNCVNLLNNIESIYIPEILAFEHLLPILRKRSQKDMKK